MEFQDKEIQIEVLYGSLEIKTLELPFIKKYTINKIENNNIQLNYTKTDEKISFDKPITINKNEILNISIY
mgnify:CR=1 FL=1